MIYRGAEGYSGSLRCFTYVHVLHESFPRLNGVRVCSTSLFDVVSNGGKIVVYIVLYSVQDNTRSYY
jgi:hypothetical protein